MINRRVDIISVFFNLPVTFCALAAFFFTAGAFSGAFARNSSKEPQTISIPGETVVSVVDFMETGDGKKLNSILGIGKRSKEGDNEAGRFKLDNFIKPYEEETPGQTESSDKADLDKWDDDLPTPVINKGGKWLFDIHAGKEEQIRRRIGKNEHNAIDVLRRYADARLNHSIKGLDGDDILYHVRESVSGKGNKNGPYRGYFYKTIKSQGPGAVGGTNVVVLKDKMPPGFAAIAWPAKYGSSGIMTYMIDQTGVVYEKDQGRETDRLAVSIESFDPDKTWKILRSDIAKELNHPGMKSDSLMGPSQDRALESPLLH
jgi:hypothetical protein